jgi:short chain dehydrogenase
LPNDYHAERRPAQFPRRKRTRFPREDSEHHGRTSSRQGRLRHRRRPRPGRSHAIRLAEEGADIIAVDVLQDYETVSYGMGTEQDLADTVTAVAALGRKIIARKADVRDAAAIRQVVDEGVAELGKLDIAVGNAGICTVQA